ncbi:MAG TPA: type II toxin-antitoxin system HipA family toxin YjjJ [bacterium]|nr:type II toxin-antitoxin system HipA family toxin YjjJ [bacterium]
MQRNEELRQILLRFGPSTARDLCLHLEISQPTLSRLLADLEKEILRTGKGKQTRYALKGLLPTGHDHLPLYTIDAEGTASRAGALHAVQPQGYYLESLSETLSSRFYRDLPYLFEDLRPAGFLGRMVPSLHPDLQAPSDIRDWNDGHCLAYWIRYGWDLVGNFLFGDSAFEKYLENTLHPPDEVHVEARAERYPQIANLAMSVGVPGSSAGGEQAKFLAIRVSGRGSRPVLVKFSPPTGDAIGRRIADLLVCEHIAHEVLRSHGQVSSQSDLVSGGNRLFLEIERFDRTDKGRKGLLSLLPLNMEFVGKAISWTNTADALFSQKKIDGTSRRNIAWLETFGRLIGNTDMHLGNISFFAQGEKLLGLAPVYDMLPMLYAPQQNQLVERPFSPPLPHIQEAPFWAEALTAARDFWQRVQAHPGVSEGFKRTTSENEAKLARLSAAGDLLPRS